MKYSKDEKQALFIEYQAYIDVVVWKFIDKNPLYLHQKDELLSIAYLAFVECLEDYDPEKGALTTLIFHYVTNACIDFGKKEVNHLKFTAEYAKEMEHYGDMSYEYDVDGFEKLICQGNLTEIQKDVLRCRYLLGMTFRETGEFLDGRDESTIRESERSALGKLKGMLQTPARKSKGAA